LTGDYADKNDVADVKYRIGFLTANEVRLEYVEAGINTGGRNRG
jgi:hypothetical protein